MMWDSLPVSLCVVFGFALLFFLAHKLFSFLEERNHRYYKLALKKEENDHRAQLKKLDLDYRFDVAESYGHHPPILPDEQEVSAAVNYANVALAANEDLLQTSANVEIDLYDSQEVDKAIREIEQAPGPGDTPFP